MRDPILVLKFGSSVLRSEEDLPRVVHEIYRWYRQGYRVVAIVSAFAGVTDDLFARSRASCANADAAATAALVATGEEISAALLGLALDRAGVPASVLDAVAIGLQTVGTYLDADPVDLDVDCLWRQLNHRPVAVVPGFVGRQDDGSISLLGRGGSDLTAVFLAQRLNARCRLIKDVSGLYEYDPADGGRFVVETGTALSLPDDFAESIAPRRFRQIRYDDACDLDGQIVQAKAIRFAQEHGQTFEVSSIAADSATEVGAAESTFFPNELPKPPLRIGLLGLGTVGLGVFQRLVNEPERFVISGIAVLDRSKPRECLIPELVKLADARSIVAGDCELVIELIGGLFPAIDLVRTALEAGKHVITANKLLLSTYGEELCRIAQRNGVELLCSAAVGGAVPMLETVGRIAAEHEITEIAGVLNGTCNFVLDSMASGHTREDAVRLAQENGFAEADPVQDLDGSDAAQKLSLLAEAAFGCRISFEDICREGILAVSATEVRRHSEAGRVLRLIAHATRGARGIRGYISREVIAGDHPFATVRGEQNCLIVKTATGEVFTVRGRGAGRWPTAESVFADALNLWRSRRVNCDASEEEQLVGGAA